MIVRSPAALLRKKKALSPVAMAFSLVLILVLVLACAPAAVNANANASPDRPPPPPPQGQPPSIFAMRSTNELAAALATGMAAAGVTAVITTSSPGTIEVQDVSTELALFVGVAVVLLVAISGGIALLMSADPELSGRRGNDESMSAVTTMGTRADWVADRLGMRFGMDARSVSIDFRLPDPGEYTPMQRLKRH
ncbi:hypothetical protein BC828DRAFT_372796 [Blastocladiella britannica]|nr:hypothetical protein BC828DRAFT_372796 [Blastocladiella britannica]